MSVIPKRWFDADGAKGVTYAVTCGCGYERRPEGIESAKMTRKIHARAYGHAATILPVDRLKPVASLGHWEITAW